MRKINVREPEYLEVVNVFCEEMIGQNITFESFSKWLEEQKLELYLASASDSISKGIFLSYVNKHYNVVKTYQSVTKTRFETVLHLENK